MKAFIIGGAGFIGSHLVGKILEDSMEGNTVTVFDNYSSGNKEFLKEYEGERLTVIEGDVMNNFDLLIESMKGHDVVFHLSANPDIKKGASDPNVDIVQGTLVTHHVLQAMVSNGIKRLVFTSSSAVYGNVPYPAIEQYTQLYPASFYGASKAACEADIISFATMFGLNVYIFRLANIVGDRMTHGVIYDFINKLSEDPTKLEVLGDGNQRKTYLHVNDCVEGILYGLDKLKANINIVNLTASSTSNVEFIAHAVASAMKLRPEITYKGGRTGWLGDVPMIMMSSKVMDVLGWRASMTSDEAVVKAINDHLRQA